MLPKPMIGDVFKPTPLQTKMHEELVKTGATRMIITSLARDRINIKQVPALEFNARWNNETNA